MREKYIMKLVEKSKTLEAVESAIRALGEFTELEYLKKELENKSETLMREVDELIDEVNGGEIDMDRAMEFEYHCRKKVLHPPKGLITCNCAEEYKESVIVDECIADEIESLWNHGIKTTGCCCGHGRNLGFIQVRDECIEKMSELGYQNYIYENEFGGIKRKDAFIPKTTEHKY